MITHTEQHVVIDLKTGETTAVYLQSDLSDATFSPDGKQIMFAAQLPDSLPVVNANYHDNLALACNRVFRDFTSNERRTYSLPFESPTCPQFGLTVPPTPTPAGEITWSPLPSLTPLPGGTTLPPQLPSPTLTSGPIVEPTEYPTATNEPSLTPWLTLAPATVALPPATATIPEWTPIASPTASNTPTITPTVNPTSMAEINDLEPSAVLIYGPVDGSLPHNGDDSRTVRYEAAVNVTDFVTSVRFYAPYAATENSWDVGLYFGDNDYDDEYRVIVTSEKNCIISYGAANQLIVTNFFRLNTGAGEANDLRVRVKSSKVSVWINGEAVYEDFMVRDGGPEGNIVLTTGNYLGNEITGKSTRFEAFTIWQLPLAE
jgi:hypothetical protein